MFELMTQALAGFNDQGIVLATDSRATRYMPDGQQEYFYVEKLYPIGNHMVVLSGGAGVSVSLSLALRHQLIRRQGLLDLEELVEFSIGYLSDGYGRHIDQHGPDREGLQRIYFILAGFFPELPPPGYQIILLGSENNELPLRRIAVTNQVVMPRNMGMEMRLLKTLSQNGPVEEILEMSRSFLEKMSGIEEAVGPPFYYAVIDRDGYRPMRL
jgi:hypothetical protein